MTVLTSTNALRSRVVGADAYVPVAGGSRPYVNFDNAASTPPLVAVRDAVSGFADWYSSVHRGTGYRSRVSTQAYEEARTVAADFLGVDRAAQSVVFVNNTTDAVNKVAGQLARQGRGKVLTTVMEHHANLLPWRHRSGHILTGLRADGRLDLEALERTLSERADQIALVAVTGASNVTGYVTPIHEIAELAHRHGALVFVDAAQLTPHRAIDVRPVADPGHLDLGPSSQ
ncbi:MAG: aminotransferase class V-fold PLP-dependent enzyme [Candidatus Dormibacteria bacterium]